MENELNSLDIMIFVCAAFVPLWFISSRFRYYGKAILYTICLIIAGTIGAFMSLPNGITPKNHWYSFRAFQLLTFWCGISYEIRNRNFIEVNSPFIIVANHQTFLDVLCDIRNVQEILLLPPVSLDISCLAIAVTVLWLLMSFESLGSALTHVWPQNCVVLLKNSLKFIPGFNICAYLCGSIFIHRFSKVDARKSVEQAISAIQNQRQIWVFPEGTRNASGTMLPFKKGAFIIARETNVPIIPIVISPYQSFYCKADYKFDYGGHVIIEVLPALNPSAYSDIESLSEECRKQMEIVFQKLSRELR